MHTKRLGNLGEMKVATELLALGYSVFIELGDISRIDLVLEVKSKLIGIQVKTVTKTNGVYSVCGWKSGPNYRFQYNMKDCQIYAVYCVDDDKIAWIRNDELLKTTGSHLTLRADPPKNGQNSKVNLLSDYLDVMRVLRDYEQDTLTVKTEGDDIVQTTMMKISQ